MAKKESSAIEIETVGKTISLTFNEKMIMKGGKIKINYTNDIPIVFLSGWYIGYKRKRNYSI